MQHYLVEFTECDHLYVILTTQNYGNMIMYLKTSG